ncbi:hypothetical protein HGRIS_006202 [Hohenbuehelia grisea]|uniref:MARVEL domain-containing protein n=1 Tax=Hohenbuehelia grisea TaxID=104357 RepID=A0ABR3K046_9AGAR
MSESLSSSIAMMVFDFPPLRIALYFALAIFSFVLFCLSAVRLHYTTHLPPGDPLNQGVNFYDPVVAELLFTTIITMAWSIFIIRIIHKRIEHGIMYTFRAELIGLGVLWLFWLIGAAVASSIWGDLSTFCPQYEACRILTALLAFCWLGWIVLTAIVVLTVLFVVANRVMLEPLHGRWDPRASRASTYRESRNTFNIRPFSVGSRA